MKLTPAIISSILAFAATTASATEWNSPQSDVAGLHFKREAYAYPLAYADPYAYSESYGALETRTPKFHIGGHPHHEGVDPKPKGGSDSDNYTKALAKATRLFKALQSGILKVSESDAAKLAGLGCDVNDIASLFTTGNDIATNVSNGVTVACSAGKIVKTVAGINGGGKTKRWENYRRAAAAEAGAWADAEAYGEEEMMLVARYIHGLE
ncbi:hypothetical protein MMC14_000685 [Varicellaria rhodocarpa]|nr:hypothetical protein [Varicellaria rhodocarpa]